jgi:hypothetical protein
MFQGPALYCGLRDIRRCGTGSPASMPHMLNTLSIGARHRGSSRLDHPCGGAITLSLASGGGGTNIDR